MKLLIVAEILKMRKQEQVRVDVETLKKKQSSMNSKHFLESLHCILVGQFRTRHTYMI
jgi:hypothetical protein